MISSTAKDLPEHRQQVLIACVQAGFTLPKMMEHLPALDVDPSKASLEMVDDADVYLGIFGFRYGYVPDGSDISITEMEYDRAVKQGKHRLLFFMDEKHSITPDMVETGDTPTTKLRALKERARRERVVNFFKNPDDLRGQVLASLNELKPSLNFDHPGIVSNNGPNHDHSNGGRATAIPPGSNPYVGLGAFRIDDADRFFGREDLVNDLWQTFSTLQGQEYKSDPPTRLLAIIGASGSGKSSVAQAGLLAKIQQSPMPDRPDPKIAVFTPEARPLESLALALAKLATDDPTPVGKAKEFEKVLKDTEDGDGMRFLVDSLPDKAPIILLVDQFEEAYSLCDDKEERSQFINNLLNAAKRPDGPLSILLTLRSDFLGAVNDHRELSNLIAAQHEVVPVMKELELRRAIEEPAKAEGRSLDPAVVFLLIEQSAGEQGALPLLEFALSRIWDGLKKGETETETLEKLGGVGGALAKEATELFEGLRAQDKVIAKRAFLAMVHIGEGSKDTRQRALVQDIVAKGEDTRDVERVLRLFSTPSRRLITHSATKNDEPTIELSHEALIDHWAKLSEWLEEGREDERFRYRLNEATHAWNEKRGGLWHGIDLARLRSFASENRSELNSYQLDFFKASNRRRSLSLFTRSISAALIVIAIGLFWYAEDQRRANSLVDSLNRALQTRHYINLNVPLTGVRTALKGLPSDGRNSDRPWVAETAGALVEALGRLNHERTVRGHTDIVSSVALSHDEKQIVSGSVDGTVRIWDTASGNAIDLLRAHKGVVHTIAVSSDGTEIMSASDDGTIKTWDKVSGDLVQQIEQQGSRVLAAAISGDSSVVVTGAEDSVVRVWEASSGKLIDELVGHEGAIHAVAASYDGSMVASGSEDQNVRLWNRITKQAVTLEGHTQTIKALAVSDDGSWIVSGAREFDSSIRVWSGIDGRLLHELEGHDWDVVDLAISSDNARVVSASWDGKIMIWNLQNGDVIDEFSDPDQVCAAFAAVAHTTNLSKIVSGACDNTIAIWKLSDRKLIHEFDGHEESVNAIDFLPDGRHIVSGSHDATIRLWDMIDESGPKLVGMHDDKVFAVTVSPNGAQIASGSRDGTIRIWDVADQKVSRRFDGHGDTIKSLAWSPDGKRIVSGSSDKTVRIWDLNMDKEPLVLEGHEHFVESVAFTCDSTKVASSSHDMTIRLWDANTGQEINALHGHKGIVWSIAMSPNGKHIVSGSQDRTVRVWDIATGEQLTMFEGHESDIESVNYSPSGNRIVSGGWDNTVRIWDLDQGQEALILRDYSSKIHAAAFDPEGEYIVSSSDDSKVKRTWIGRNKQELIKHATNRVARIDGTAESQFVDMEQPVLPEGTETCLEVVGSD